MRCLHQDTAQVHVPVLVPAQADLHHAPAPEVHPGAAATADPVIAAATVLQGTAVHPIRAHRDM